MLALLIVIMSFISQPAGGGAPTGAAGGDLSGTYPNPGVAKLAGQTIVEFESNFATSAQGAKADTAVQPGDSGLVTADSGWTANADAGDKTAVVPTAASVAGGKAYIVSSIDASQMNGVAEFLTYLQNGIEKVKALEAASGAGLRPSA